MTTLRVHGDGVLTHIFCFSRLSSQTLHHISIFFRILQCKKNTWGGVVGVDGEEGQVGGVGGGDGVGGGRVGGVVWLVGRAEVADVASVQQSMLLKAYLACIFCCPALFSSSFLSFSVLSYCAEA